MTTTLSIRIEEKTKKAAQKTLASMGIDISSAVKMFLHQVVLEEGMPFTPTRNTKDIRKKWDKEVRDAVANGKGYNKAGDMLQDILSGK